MYLFTKAGCGVFRAQIAGLLHTVAATSGWFQVGDTVFRLFLCIEFRHLVTKILGFQINPGLNLRSATSYSIILGAGLAEGCYLCPAVNTI